MNSSPNGSLRGKVALVTGASGDLGRTIARTLAAAGADIAVHYRSRREIAEEVAESCRANGVRAMTVTGDIADLAQMTAAHQAVTATLGGVDIAVANAVSQIPWLSVLDQPLDDFTDQFRSCVLHAAVLAKVCVPAMRERGWGRIIGINTECVIECRANSSAYASGKGGMDRLLRCLAREVGADGITVNQVAPGYMISERNRKAGGGADDDGLTPEQRAGYVQGVPLGHRGSDRDIADAVTFLAGPAGRFITGAFLPVCGGRVMTGI
jgi:3-oxoacyl-[acyl-carrier protein] reductase